MRPHGTLSDANAVFREARVPVRFVGPVREKLGGGQLRVSFFGVRLRWYDRLAGRLIALYVLLRTVTG